VRAEGILIAIQRNTIQILSKGHTNNHDFDRFDVLIAVSMTITVFWDVKRSNLIEELLGFCTFPIVRCFWE
jgi:hypothetical protein